MAFLTYLLHLPSYIGLPIIFALGFIGVVTIVSMPLVIAYWLDDGDYSATAEPVDYSTDGGAAACAVICVVCI